MSKFTDNLTMCNRISSTNDRNRISSTADRDRISSTDDRDRIPQHITMYGIFRWNVPGKGGF